MAKIKEKNNAIVIYEASRGDIRIDVRLENETVWLDAHQMAKIFGVNRPVVVKHINNIYKTGELQEKSTCSILEQVAADGKVRKMNLYNLDMVISAGYRVNSQRATQFRIWATKTLKDYLVKGYVVNEKRLLETKNKFNELQNAIAKEKGSYFHPLCKGGLRGDLKSILAFLCEKKEKLCF